MWSCIQHNCELNTTIVLNSTQPVISGETRSFGWRIQTTVKIPMTVIQTVKGTICWRHHCRSTRHRVTCQLETICNAVVAEVGRNRMKTIRICEISRRMKELKAVAAVNDVTGRRIGQSAAERLHAETKTINARVKSGHIGLEKVGGRLVVWMEVAGRGGLVCTEHRPIARFRSRRRALRRRLEPMPDWMNWWKPTITCNCLKPVAGSVRHVVAAMQQCRIPHSKHLVGGSRLWRRRCNRFALDFGFRNRLRYAGTTESRRRHRNRLWVNSGVRSATATVQHYKHNAIQHINL